MGRAREFSGLTRVPAFPGQERDRIVREGLGAL